MNQVGNVSSLGSGRRPVTELHRSTPRTDALSHQESRGSTPVDDERRFGPYSFVRHLETGRLGERWLALHDRDLSSHVVHRIVLRHDNHSRRKFLHGVQPLAELSHPHLLSVEQYSMDVSGRGCIVTPFTGNSDGLLTLAGLLQLKGGRFSPSEARRATLHLLEASAHAHDRGQAHGPLTLDQILVDRHGRIQIELYGMERALGARITSTDDLVRGEVWSILSMSYRLITGVRAESPPVAVSEILKAADGRKLEGDWDGFFAKGLDEIDGFATASEALAALPGERPTDNPPTGGEPQASAPLRSLLARLVEKVRRPVLE